MDVASRHWISVLRRSSLEISVEVWELHCLILRDVFGWDFKDIRRISSVGRLGIVMVTLLKKVGSR